MNITVCMIVKNEEAHLERCLNSVNGLGSIVIVDTGSEDTTCQIARKFTEHVYENEYKWNDSMCEARNYALDKCSGDWILSIDADEYLEDGSQDKIYRAIQEAEKKGFRTVSVNLKGENSNSVHQFPRLFKKGVRWKGAIHNYLDVSENNPSDITIIYGYSEAHKKDPDRALRILTKEAAKPESIRELFYLAREYWYRNAYKTAIEWYHKYLTRAYWSPEMADANLMLGRCYWRLGNAKDAVRYAMEAIHINNDYKEALEFLADLCGPKNSERWLYMAYLAKNQDVLFVNEGSECDNRYYDRIYSVDDCSRYEELYKTVATVVQQIKAPAVMDIGCGTAELSKYIKCQYTGIDFNEAAIKIARTKTQNVYVANLYEFIDLGNVRTFDMVGNNATQPTYIMLEVLEHIDDLKLIDLMAEDSRVIISVPSFGDKSHLRRYTERIIRDRFKDIIKITMMERFNWNKRWVRGGANTTDHITLFGGIVLK